MLSKVASRSLWMGKHLRTQVRAVSSQIMRSDALAREVVAKDDTTGFELQGYSHDNLKKFFDQDAYLYPIEQIIEKVEQKDYKFFLGHQNFLKVVDTIEKFQSNVVDLDSQPGRDFMVFKRQLYQLYEIQNRSIDEHEAYSFEIERQNLKWIYNAREDFSKELDRANAISDLESHVNLGGKVFKRKLLDPARLHGLGCFGLAGATWMMFPHVALMLGPTLTTALITSSSLGGMLKLNEKGCVNSISLGEESGQININVSTSPFTSRNLVASVNDIQAIYSVGNDDMGENDIENNVVSIRTCVDSSTGEVLEDQAVTLPADSWKDVNMLDWILSIKSQHPDMIDSTQDEFNDLMTHKFESMSSTGKQCGHIGFMSINGAYMKKASAKAIDMQIDAKSPDVDMNLELMKKIYGEKLLNDMSPGEFYTTYQKFAQNQLKSDTAI